MLNYILKPIKHESFYRKYAGKKFLKVRFLRAFSSHTFTFVFILLVEHLRQRMGY